MKITKSQLKQIIKEEVSSLTETYESKMSCEMKGGTWHRKAGDGPGQGECSFDESLMKEESSSTTYYGLVEVPYEPSIILHGSSVEEIKEEAKSYGWSGNTLVAIFTADIIEGNL